MNNNSGSSLRTGISGIRETDVDYQCFAIWEVGRSREQEIIDALQGEFGLVANFLIAWSTQNYFSNVERLYETTVLYGDESGIRKKIGRTPFRFLVVRDEKPEYGWAQSASGEVQRVNLRAVKAKSEFRTWFEKDFQVHSSVTPDEFCAQAGMVLGPRRLQTIVSKAPGPQEQFLEEDIAGADGWNSIDDMLELINLASRHVVLRDWRALKSNRAEGEIEFLTDDISRLSALLNAKPQEDAPWKGTIEIDGRTTNVIIRYVGDGYFPHIWSDRILQSRMLVDGIYVPDHENQFFSIAYHGIVHRGGIDERYIPILRALDQEMGFRLFKDTEPDLDAIGDILSGYLKANRYYYATPVDKGVGQFNVRQLPAARIGPRRKTRSNPIKRLQRSIRKRLPGSDT